MKPNIPNDKKLVRAQIDAEYEKRLKCFGLGFKMLINPLQWEILREEGWSEEELSNQFIKDEYCDEHNT